MVYSVSIQINMPKTITKFKEPKGDEARQYPICRSCYRGLARFITSRFF